MWNCQALCAQELARGGQLLVDRGEDGHMRLPVFVSPRSIASYSSLRAVHHQDVFHVGSPCFVFSPLSLSSRSEKGILYIGAGKSFSGARRSGTRDRNLTIYGGSAVIWAAAEL